MVEEEVVVTPEDISGITSAWALVDISEAKERKECQFRALETNTDRDVLGTAEKSLKVGSEVKVTSCNNLPHGESQEDVQDWG